MLHHRNIYRLVLSKPIYMLAVATTLVSFNSITADELAANKPGSPIPKKTLEEELPRIPGNSPEKAGTTFEVTHGFEMQLVSSEPMLGDPVDACFDANGRMYVAEMHGYPFSQEPTKLNPKGGGKPDAGIIRLLSDSNGDGKMDKSHVFADMISWPLSVCCYRGGVFVLAPPHIYYLKDTDGDNRADVREIVYSGFKRDNVQGLANNLKWGLDNRIYGAGGPNGSDLTHRDKTLFSLRGRDFAFDPVTEQLEPTSGGAQFGSSFDDWGNRYVCSNSNHIQQIIYPDRYIKRNPSLAVSGVRRTIAADGAAAPVFRLSSPEPWRIVRTRRRNADPRYKNLPPSEKVNAGFFTSAAGITIYRGDAYRDIFHGNAFVGDVGGNLIHRKVLEPNGVAQSAKRVDPRHEFVASTDNWFRPVNFVNAPDGTLWVMDMYRETIEHPYSIPEDIKAYLHLESGDDMGRIWRLAPTNWKPKAIPRLGDAKVQTLVAQLESSNGWNRATAQRLLVERQDPSAAAHLRSLLKVTQSPRAIIHGLWILKGLKALQQADLISKFQHADEHVREHAIWLAETFATAEDNSKLLAAMLKRVDDPADRVRFQLAFTLGEFEESKRYDALRQLAPHIAHSPELRTAWLSSLGNNVADVAISLLNEPEYWDAKQAIDLQKQMAQMVGSNKNDEHAIRLLSAIVKEGNFLSQRQQRELVPALGDALLQRGSSISQLIDPANEELKRDTDIFFGHILPRLHSRKMRRQHSPGVISMLAYAPKPFAKKHLAEYLQPTAAQDSQKAAVQALGKHTGTDIGEVLLEQWRSYSPPVRTEVVDAMLSRAERINQLLDAIEAEDVRLTEIATDKKQILMNHPNKEIRKRSQALLKGASSTDRAKVVADYEACLKMEGNAKNGLAVYKKNCATCHRVGKEGHQVGPDMVSIKNKSKNDLLISILDPNREAQPNFTTYTIITNGGTIKSGIIATETATSITLRAAEGKEETILRSNIDELISNGLSLMPAGLEKEVTQQQMADLLAFIKGL